MKTLKISNGEIRKGYEITDLSEEVKNKVISEHLAFMESLPIECEQEDGTMEDEYMEFTEEETIENIEINKYLYDEEGELLPICYHTKENEVVRMSYGRGKKGEEGYAVEFI